MDQDLKRRRHVQQLRPKGELKGPMYSPQRDLAYIFAPACKEAFAGLDAVHWQEYFKGWLAVEGLTEDDLGHGVKLFSDAIQLFTNEPGIETPADAFERVGFFQVPHPVRIMIYERIGEVITGGFFVALRDVSPMNDTPNEFAQLEELIGAGRVMAERLCGAKPVESATDKIVMDMHTQAAELEFVSRALTTQRTENDTLRRQAVATARELQDNEEMHNTSFNALAGRGLWAHLVAWWQGRP